MDVAPLRSLALVAVLCLSGGAAVGALGEAVAPAVPTAERRAGLFAAAAPRVEAVAVGNSHNRALDFEALGVEGFHLWWDGGDVFEAARALEVAVAAAPGLRVAFAPVSPFLRDNGALAAADPAFAAPRLRAHVEHGDFRPIGGDAEAAVRALVTPLARPDAWEAVLQPSGPDPEAARIDPDGFPRRPAPRRQPSAAALAASADRKAAHHLGHEQVSLERTPDLCAETLGAFDAMAATAARAGLRLVLYTPPYAPAYARAAGACPADAHARRLDRALAHVVYLDRREGALADPALFEDADHLNRDGARAFSTRLRADLEALDAPAADRAPSPPPYASRRARAYVRARHAK